jgi:hypothetical protein
MATLNRFPLLGLWAKEAARRQGYTKDEAQALGHAYAVLYAIRAQKHPKTEADREKAAAKRPARKPRGIRQIRFGGDDLDVVYDADGRAQGKVGGEKPQTARTYQASVEGKFPPGYYPKLEKAFRRVLRRYTPGMLNGRVVYNLYDEWKEHCAVGRRVDLNCLLEWCDEKASE